MCACYTVYVKEKFIKAFTFYILNFHLFYMYVFCLHVFLHYVCALPTETRKEWVSDPQGLELLQRIVNPCVFWELFLVAPECSAFSPALYFLRHSCFKRMCSVDWPGTQTSICLCLPRVGIVYQRVWIGQEVATLTVLILAGSVADCPTSIPCFHQCWKSWKYF